jgi:hypothetical protein
MPSANPDHDTLAGRAVENLWINRENLVRNLTANIFLEPDRPTITSSRDVGDAFAIPFA